MANKSTIIKAELQKLSSRREEVALEQKSVSDTLDSLKQSVINNDVEVKTLTETQNLLNSYEETLEAIDYQIQELTNQLEDVSEDEARNYKLRKIVELDQTAEHRSRELQALIDNFNRKAQNFMKKRGELVSEIIQCQKDFNNECEKLIPELVRGRSSYVLGLEEKKDSLLVELQSKGAKLNALRAGESVNNFRLSMNSHHKTIRTFPDLSIL